MILWNEKKIIEEDINFIDSIFSCEIPDKNKLYNLHNIVLKHIIHDPCTKK